jgi:hypothetical protein
MRAMFLSNTQGNVYDVWGKIVKVEEVAETLIDEAKMTRSKVLESEEQQPLPESEMVESEWRRLRWEPDEGVGASTGLALQSFFARADEESRKPKVKVTEGLKKHEEPRVNDRRFEVVVESAVVSDEIEAVVESKDEINEGKVYEDKVVELKEESKESELPKVAVKTSLIEKKVERERESNRDEEIKKIMKQEYGEKLPVATKKEMVIEPFLVKNSNSRFVKPPAVEEPSMIPEIVEKEELVREKPMVKESPKVEKKLEIAEVKKDNGGIFRAMMWSGVVIVVLVILGIGWWSIDNYRMVKNTFAIVGMVNAKKFDEAEKLANRTVLRVEANEQMLEKWRWNSWVWGRRYQDLLRVMEQGLRLEVEAVQLAKRSETISDGMFKDKDMDWKKELDGLKKEVDMARASLALLSARMAGDWSWIPNRWRGDFNSAKNKVEEVSGIVAKVARAVDFLPEIMGTDGKRREFMVLLQNESEIRPGGGFIGSYGILSFENGKLLNFEISDVYEADGQLKGHVEPPAAIKKYLGEAKWYMRDANWQPDFGVSARDIQWFLEKETGRKVDGVIGVDLAVAKAILGVTGEIYVPDFKEKINRNNLYEQAEFYSETKFFPGSKQKASFLGGLGRQLFEEIKNLKGEQRLKMVQALVEMLDRNEIQIALTNQGAAKVVAELGWDGAMYDGKCAVDRCFADYLYIVEANLGVNKANYFLYRSIDQTIDIGKQTIGRVVKISYENTAKNNNWPGGDYKNYMRMYIPASANVAEVSVTDVEANGIKTIYSGDNLSIETNKGKKELGFLVVVPAGKKRMVEVRYVDQVDLTTKEKFSYLNYIQRQPGYGDTGLVSLVTLPEGWQVNQVEPVASMMSGKLLFNQKLDRDIKMGVEISK